jgi:hypothetical protein
MAITWTKNWSGSDDGTILKGSDLGNIQNDMASVLQTSDIVEYDGNDTWDPGSIAIGGSETTTVTATGAVLGDFAMASFSLDTQGLTLTATVTSANTVTAVLSNNTAGAVDLASGTIYVRVFPRT